MLRRPLTLAIALLALLPAAASSATLTTDRSCYGRFTYINLTGSGFAPNGQVYIYLGDNLASPAVNADGSGNFTARIPSTGVGSTRRTTVVAKDRFAGSRAEAPITIVRTYVRVVPRSPAPGRRVSLAAFGFTPGAPLFLHLRGKVRSDVRLGTPSGDCGTLSVRRTILRSDDPDGRYRFQFDPNRGFRGLPGQDAGGVAEFPYFVYLFRVG
jgi:hypothetical protein